MFSSVISFFFSFFLKCLFCEIVLSFHHQPIASDTWKKPKQTNKPLLLLLLFVYQPDISSSSVLQSFIVCTKTIKKHTNEPHRCSLITMNKHTL